MEKIPDQNCFEEYIFFEGDKAHLDAGCYVLDFQTDCRCKVIVLRYSYDDIPF